MLVAPETVCVNINPQECEHRIHREERSGALALDAPTMLVVSMPLTLKQRSPGSRARLTYALLFTNRSGNSYTRSTSAASLSLCVLVLLGRFDSLPLFELTHHMPCLSASRLTLATQCGVTRLPL